MSGRLTGAAALVTGGSQGIGAAIVETMAAEGAHVVFCARTIDPGISLETRLRDRGLDVSFVRSDVTDEDQVERLLAHTIRTIGGLDILVNCAATTANEMVERMSLDTWTSVLDCNLTGTFLVCKHAIPHLRRSESASIINLGSTYGFVGVPGLSAYAATKSAVISLTKSLALELAEYGIRVNALCPGVTDTPLTDAWLATEPEPDQALATLLQRHPLGRMATPEEPAAGAVFLASRDASYITGHTLMVDGGFLAK